MVQLTLTLTQVHLYFCLSATLFLKLTIIYRNRVVDLDVISKV